MSEHEEPGTMVVVRSEWNDTRQQCVRFAEKMTRVRDLLERWEAQYAEDLKLYPVPTVAMRVMHGAAAELRYALDGKRTSINLPPAGRVKE